MKQALLVYPGLGKTTLSKSDDRFEDLETKLFKDLSLKQYIGTKDYPNYRGNVVLEKNPEYPENIRKYTLELTKQNKILLLVFKQDSIDLLNSLNIDYDIILPSIERLEQLKQDYISRGDNEEYIEHNLTTRYSDALKQVKDLNKKLFLLEKGQYLQDFVKEMQ